MGKLKLVAEIGINHGGVEDTALKLIRAAAESGASGVKFQYRNLDNAYADISQIGDEILLKEIRTNFLSPTQILRLAEAAHDLGLQVGTSFFNVDDIEDFNEDLEVFDFFKVPSVELSNFSLIDRLLETDKSVLISTGCHTEEDIERSFSRLEKDNWIPLHCISNYPVIRSNAKLGYLDFLKKRWARKVGYSSHDEEWETCLIALQLGAEVIERHITLDKKAEGLDHTSSSTPDEFARLANYIQEMNMITAGNYPRTANQGEILNLQNLGRSYYSNRDILEGEIITIDMLSLKSPQIGFDSKTVEDGYCDIPVIRTVKAGEVIDLSVFTKRAELSEKIIEFAKQKQLSLPVRFHDFKNIEAALPIGSYEFHLSFGEVLGGFDFSECSKNNRYSIHLPDYISSTELMDLFSPKESQRMLSREILDKTAEYAQQLQDITGKEVPIVGSFSIVHKNRNTFYQKHSEYLTKYANRGIHVLPQWLPPIAWYFGGSIPLQIMNNDDDVNMIHQINMPFCLDICHLCMGESAFNFDALKNMQILESQIKHMHLADAIGIDGEGVLFGDGDSKNMKVIQAALEVDCIKVIEVWQGHLHGGQGFATALNRLFEVANV